MMKGFSSMPPTPKPGQPADRPDKAATSPPDAFEPMVRIDAAARFFDVSIKTIRRYCGLLRDPLPYYKIGGRLTFKASEMQDWANRRRNRPTPPHPGRKLKAVDSTSKRPYDPHVHRTGAHDRAGRR